VVAKVRERLVVTKQNTHGVNTERFNLKKLLKEAEGKGQYRVEISNRYQLRKTLTLKWILRDLGKLLERI
jgi:hypothetical protein